MLKLLKNLKNSWASVLIIVILLCIQAAADLALPDYTSKIVKAIRKIKSPQLPHLDYTKY